MAGQRIAKWTRWIDGPIKTSVLTMHLQRDAWLDVGAILRENGQLPDSYWWEFMVDTYLTTQAMAIRRQADLHKDAASLGKLIGQVRDDASGLTRDWWLGLWNDSDDPFVQMDAERGWRDQWAGSVGDCLDPAIAAADFETLQTASSKVRSFVDRHIAHSESKLQASTPDAPAEAESAPPTVTLTTQDVHEAIDVIGEQFSRYYNLFTASSWAMLVPVIQHDWKAIFREPWMRSTGPQR